MGRSSFLVICAFLLLAKISYCDEVRARTVRQLQPRIVGGTDTVRGKFPYQGLLEIEYRNGSLSRFLICGCSLIHSRWAVTAAQCVEKKQASDLSLYFGRVYLSNFLAGDLYSVITIYRHPYFNDSLQDFRNDISLLQINGSVTMNKYVSPILLPVSQGNPQVGQLCNITGWGSMSEFSSNQSQVLQKAAVPIVSNARCGQTFEEIFSEQICAGYEEGGVDICAGDAGAPLVCTSPAGNPVLQGIGSFGSGCARPGIPSGYTRVSSFVDWIQTTTGSDEIETDESTLIQKDTTRNEAVTVNTTGSDEVKTDESILMPKDTTRNEAITLSATGDGAITAASRETAGILAATAIIAAYIRSN